MQGARAGRPPCVMAEMFRGATSGPSSPTSLLCVTFHLRRGRRHAWHISMHFIPELLVEQNVLIKACVQFGLQAKVASGLAVKVVGSRPLPWGSDGLATIWG